MFVKRTVIVARRRSRSIRRYSWLSDKFLAYLTDTPANSQSKLHAGNHLRAGFTWEQSVSSESRRLKPVSPAFRPSNFVSSRDILFPPRSTDEGESYFTVTITHVPPRRSRILSSFKEFLKRSIFPSISIRDVIPVSIVPIQRNTIAFD